MGSPIGSGYYQRSVSVRDDLGVYLFHLRDGAAETRAHNPDALIVWRGDPGKDGLQVNFEGDPVQEADRFFEAAIRPKVDPGVYWASCGINEAWPAKEDKAGLAWRAKFELRLCQRVQNDLRVAYLWGAISTGNLEPADLGFFLPLFKEAYAVNYHAYLKPGRLSAAAEDPDVEPWWIYRPTRLWLPRLKQLGVGSFRLFLGECGCYYPEVKGEDLARLAIEVHRAIRADCQKVGVVYLGACAYGAGMIGDQGEWEIESSVHLLAEANEADKAFPPFRPRIASSVSIPTNSTTDPTTSPTIPTTDGGTKMALKDQYAADYNAWVAAGGVDNNFLAHLVGIGKVTPNKAQILTIVGNARSSLAQIENVVKNLPLA